MSGWLSIAAEMGGASAPVVGALAAWYGIRQYRIQNTQKRAEKFFEWNKWFDSKEGFGVDPDSSHPSVLQLLEDDDERLKMVPWEKREALLAFFEEIALAVNSKLLDEDTANYMFGYYALKIRKSSHFWENLDAPDSGYWKLFRSCTERWEAKYDDIRTGKFDPKKLKF
jgi:hypothetical protein